MSLTDEHVIVPADTSDDALRAAEEECRALSLRYDTAAAALRTERTKARLAVAEAQGRADEALDAFRHALAHHQSIVAARLGDITDVRFIQ